MGGPGLGESVIVLLVALICIAVSVAVIMTFVRGGRKNRDSE